MKKKLKFGFTLAEVLITLAIIGVVAAITIPMLGTSAAYKEVGVKIAKFIASTENSNRAFVASNGNLKNDGTFLKSYVKDSFLFDVNQKKISDLTITLPAATTIKLQNNLSDTDDTSFKLKDGTRIKLYSAAAVTGSDPYTPGTLDTYDENTHGSFVFGIAFDPMVNGLTTKNNKVFRLLVTDIGYIFPDTSDKCIELIYKNHWVTNRDTFDDASCNATTTS